MLSYYGDDMEEYRRWEDNIKMDLKEIGSSFVIKSVFSLGNFIGWYV